MDVIFYAIPSLIIAGVLAMATVIVRRSLQLRSNWNSGLVAEARCLRAYTTTSGGGGDTSVSTTQHHVYEFTSGDGLTIRFDEANGPEMTVPGDIVTVHYTAERPDRATAHAPAHGMALAGTIGILVFLGVIVVFCVGFMVTYTEAFAGDDPFAGMP
ncbi:DUF3592 domain-containing protein [Streptomyces avermitilis]|uniref:DUF3592 domain-containing protein n=1 Tax=Streptomyces avermitilis TaxID=33903 RepID=UPI00339F8F54